MQREEPAPTLDIQRSCQRRRRCLVSRDRCRTVVVSSCCKCAAKSRNERNPYPCLPASNVGNPGRLPVMNRRSSGDDVKSSWPLRGATHVLTANEKQGANLREWANPKKCVVVRLSLQLGLHEVGIASNRRSGMLRWIRSRAFVHTWPPVTPWEWAAKEVGSLTFGEDAHHHFVGSWLGWSRISVALGGNQLDHLLIRRYTR